MMLTQDEVDKEEENLRQQINQLSDDKRKTFYNIVKRRIKDPDTYATLNWFFITGIHHFYLGKWINGIVDLLILIVGIGLIFSGLPLIGISLVVFISIIEFWALFRSQIIIQDWNNKIYKDTLRELS